MFRSSYLLWWFKRVLWKLNLKITWLNFINKVDDYYSDYELAIMFKRKQEAKYAIYILLQKTKIWIFFDPLKGMIKEYSLEMYLMVYVECLKEYINQGTRNYYLSDYIYDLFHDLDEMSKLELVECWKKNIQEKRNYMKC